MPANNRDRQISTECSSARSKMNRTCALPCKGDKIDKGLSVAYSRTGTYCVWSDANVLGHWSNISRVVAAAATLTVEVLVLSMTDRIVEI